MLTVENLTVDLPGAGRVLDGISLHIAKGGSLGLAGESGSGKSMTALAIMGLLPPGAVAGGRVLLDGTDLLTAGEAALCAIRGQRIGMVFQEPMTALNPLMRIGAQVAEPLRLHFAIGRRAAAARARALLDRVGLGGISEYRYPHQLSGGQRQRVGIAMALACDPELLIADEPTTALDVTVQAQILDLLADLAQERGMALLLITHDLGVIRETVQSMAVMYAGRIAETGDTAAVFARMAHPYTRALFAASPHMAHGVTEPIPGQVPEPHHRPPGCAFAPRCSRVQPDCKLAAPPLRDGVACLHPFPPP